MPPTDNNTELIWIRKEKQNKKKISSHLYQYTDLTTLIERQLQQLLKLNYVVVCTAFFFLHEYLVIYIYILCF